MPKLNVLVTSDLHIDTYKFNANLHIAHWSDYDIVCLCGDVSNCIYTTLAFLRSTAHLFPNTQILFVAGNHDYYTTDIESVQTGLRQIEVEYKNFKWLRVENGKAVTFKIGNVVFLGDTLWTDMEFYKHLELDAAVSRIWRRMNDFQCILTSAPKDETICDWLQKKYAGMATDGEIQLVSEYLTKHTLRFTPYTAIKLHHIQRNILMKRALAHKAKGRTVVMMTHHLPHEKSLDNRYEMYVLDHGYASDILKEDVDTGIDYWFHGHSHTTCDYTVGRTRVIANPNGYNEPNQENLNFSLEIES